MMLRMEKNIRLCFGIAAAFIGLAGSASLSPALAQFVCKDNTTNDGQGATAAGAGSTACGKNATASGGFSTATGQLSEATGERSTATGSAARATGDRSTATGQLGHCRITAKRRD